MSRKKKKTSTITTKAGLTLRMGGQPVKGRLEKAKHRIIVIEQHMTNIFKSCRVRAQFTDDFFWAALIKVRSKDKAAGRRLQDLYYQHQLHSVRYNFYHNLIFNHED